MVCSVVVYSAVVYIVVVYSVLVYSVVVYSVIVITENERLLVVERSHRCGFLLLEYVFCLLN